LGDWEELNQLVFDLCQQLRVADTHVAAPADLRGHLEAALEALRPLATPGPYGQVDEKMLMRVSPPAPEAPPAPPRPPDPQTWMPFSPIIGKRNPISPRLRMVPGEGHHLECRCVFPATFAGPPGCVHGGFVAAAFDELLGVANIVAGAAGWTGTLKVRYLRPVPLLEEVYMHAQCERVEGRKVFTSGEIHCQGELRASAEGVFIRPRSREEVSPLLRKRS